MKTLTVVFRSDYPEGLLSMLKLRETEFKLGYDGLVGNPLFGVEVPALQNNGAVANEPPTAAVTPETQDKYSGVPIYSKKD